MVQEEHFTYIPLSSFIILLVIVLTCASRKKKLESFTAVEQSLENDIKGDYAIMCFPCLKRKPELRDYEPTADMTDQFEYIVEKYTIRKVPLLLANTTEDIIERQVELEMAEAQQGQPELLKDDFINFQLTQEPQCLTVAANTVCPGRKSIKDKCLPSDILESMSPVTRPNIKNANYVVIPTKGSLRSKDIMMTKREITNQYLNNFSSVFVDNLKDQVPKDPETFPSLSRPYTSAFKDIPLAETFLKAKTTNGKRIKRSKVQKVAYSFPAEEMYIKEDDSIKEEEPYYDSDSGSKGQTTDIPDSEFQEDNDNETLDITDKSKSLVLLNDSDSVKDALEGAVNPFKTTIKSSGSEFIPRIPHPEFEYQSNSFAFQKEDWPNAKVTYEDIQALDVGYEFTSCEKLGVKPKMTRIHYPHEGDRTKDTKQVGTHSRTSPKGFYLMDQPQQPISLPKVARSALKSKGHQKISDLTFLSNIPHAKEKPTSKCSIAETSFLPKKEPKTTQPDTPAFKDLVSTTTFTSKSEESKSQSLHNIDVHSSPSGEAIDESVAEISKLYDLAMPVAKNAITKGAGGTETEATMLATATTDHSNPDEDVVPASTLKYPKPSKSRSFQEPRKETASEVKGKDYSTYPSSFAKNKSISRLDEPDTETSSSMLSRESKTSSAATSPRSSERDEGKRATLRWKIVIKHHREDDSSRKHVNKNIKI